MRSLSFDYFIQDTVELMELLNSLVFKYSFNLGIALFFTFRTCAAFGKLAVLSFTFNSRIYFFLKHLL